jgi:hypothetical protein
LSFRELKLSTYSRQTTAQGDSDGVQIIIFLLVLVQILSWTLSVATMLRKLMGRTKKVVSVVHVAAFFIAGIERATKRKIA